MKITKHHDGIVSFSQMTANDVRNLAFATSVAGTFYALKAHRAPSWNLYTTDSDGTDWDQRNAEQFDRLRTVLTIVENTAWSGSNDRPALYLPPGASITVVSDQFGPQDDAYTIVKSGARWTKTETTV